jgi:hypothetical protein
MAEIAGPGNRPVESVSNGATYQKPVYCIADIIRFPLSFIGLSSSHGQRLEGLFHRDSSR